MTNGQVDLSAGVALISCFLHDTWGVWGWGRGAGASYQHDRCTKRLNYLVHGSVMEKNAPRILLVCSLYSMRSRIQNDKSR